MKTLESPRLPTWLLRHFGSSPNNDSVIGDLVEGFREGRSRTWYWRQVLVALFVGFLREVWGHKLIAARTLFIASAIKAVWVMLGGYKFARPNSWFTQGYFAPLAPTFGSTHLQLALFVLMVLATGLICAGNAWLVARVSRPHNKPMVLLYLIVELFGWPAALMWGNLNVLNAFWTPTFSNIFATGFMHFGVFSSITAMWCGSAVLAATILLGGGFLGTAAANDSRGARTGV